MKTIKCPKCHSENLSYLGNEMFSCKDCGTFFSIPKDNEEASSQSAQEHHNTISREEIDSWPKDISNRAAKKLVKNLYEGEEILATAYSRYSPFTAIILILGLTIFTIATDIYAGILIAILCSPFLYYVFANIGRGSNFCVALTTKRVICQHKSNISYINLEQISSIDVHRVLFSSGLRYIGGTVIELYSKATEGMTLERVINGKNFYNILEKYCHQSH